MFHFLEVNFKELVIVLRKSYSKYFFWKIEFFRSVYEKTRLPLVPIYGMFPVKLRTFIGKPIDFDESLTADQLKELVEYLFIF